MNAKTLEAITRHGKSLLAAFPNSTERDPVALCKKLRRIETAVAKPILDDCNGHLPIGERDSAIGKAMNRVQKLLGFDASEIPLFVNCDPRGYALKLDDEWTRNHNASMPCTCCVIHRDWGGYGIIAPDLTA